MTWLWVGVATLYNLIKLMNKPYVDNPKYFIKKKSWFLVAWWIGYKWKELHWDYEYVRNREEWEKLLNDLKKSEWKDNVWDVDCT